MFSVTLGCTHCGFLTRETPCTPLPIPADYPDPCRGCGFLEGMGIGHHEVTWGLPMPITSYKILSWPNMIMHTVGSTDIQSTTCSARGKQYCWQGQDGSSRQKINLLGGVRVSSLVTIQQMVYRQFKKTKFSSALWELTESLLNLNHCEASLEALHHWFKSQFSLLHIHFIL